MKDSKLTIAINEFLQHLEDTPSFNIKELREQRMLQYILNAFYSYNESGHTPSFLLEFHSRYTGAECPADGREFDKDLRVMFESLQKQMWEDPNEPSTTENK